MGAACTSINCKGQKYQKQPGATIIKRPTERDFSLEEDEDELLQQKVDPRIVIPPNAEQAHIGVYFQFDELAVGVLKKEAADGH